MSIVKLSHSEKQQPQAALKIELHWYQLCSLARADLLLTERIEVLAVCGPQVYD